jgi:outer membrane receptor for Fe3+-dicitrate
MGDYSKQPFIDAVFQNFRNNINPNTRNEKVVGFEIGYGYTSEKFRANVNYYRTEWKDRFKTVGFRDGSTRGTADLQGIKQLHTGVELDFEYLISDNFKLVGMASVGDWEYSGNVSGTAFDDVDPVGLVNLYLDGVKVGNSAQTTARLGFDWDVTDNFEVDYSHRYAARLYADINTEDFQDEVNNGSLQLPNYFLGDLGMSYKFNFKNDTGLKLRLNINNLGNTVYLAESLTNNFVEGSDDDSFRGINTNNKAFFGFGRTWNFTMRYNF